MFQESVLSQGRQSKRRGNSEQMQQHGLPGPKGEKGEAGLAGEHGRKGNTGHKVGVCMRLSAHSLYLDRGTAVMTARLAREDPLESPGMWERGVRRETWARPGRRGCRVCLESTGPGDTRANRGSRGRSHWRPDRTRRSPRR